MKKITYKSQQWVDENSVPTEPCEVAGKLYIVREQKITGFKLAKLWDFWIMLGQATNEKHLEALVEQALIDVPLDLAQKGLKAPKLGEEQTQKVLNRYARELLKGTAKDQLRNLLQPDEVLKHVIVGSWAGEAKPAGDGLLEPLATTPQSYVGVLQDWSGAVGMDFWKVGPASLLGTPMAPTCWVWSNMRIFSVGLLPGGETVWKWIQLNPTSNDPWFM